eukprot:gene6712-1200_t
MADAACGLRDSQVWSEINNPQIGMRGLVILLGCTGLSLFMRTTWIHSLPDDVWRSWFDLVARGRREGPSSPFYIEELALQNTACCESPPTALGCLGSKCSDLGLPPNSLLTEELDAMSEYFPLFDKVYVGTTASYSWHPSNASSTKDYAALQASIGAQFLARYGIEWAAYLSESMHALSSVKPMVSVIAPALDSAIFLPPGPLGNGLPTAAAPKDFLWSPSNGDVSLTPSQRDDQFQGLERLFCNLPFPLAVHFQDWLGQSVSFEFPYFYNYTTAFTCEKDTVPTMQVLQRVHESCPAKLREFKVNAELFAERLNNGHRGEDGGADIINADPRE